MAWLRARRVGAVFIASKVSRFRRFRLSSGRGSIVKVLDAAARCPGARLPRQLLLELAMEVRGTLVERKNLARSWLPWLAVSGRVGGCTQPCRRSFWNPVASPFGLATFYRRISR